MKRIALLPLAVGLLLASCDQATPLPAPAFTASLNPAAVSLARGGSAIVAVTTSAPATLELSGVPTGVTVQQGAQGLTLVNASAADGVATATVTARPSGGGTPVAMTLRITTSGAPQGPGPTPVTPLVLSANPSTLTLNAGEQAFVTVGSNLPVTLGATASHGGLQLSLSNDALTVRNVSAPAGTHAVYVYGTGPQGQAAQTEVIVTVPGSTAPEFQASLSPPSVTLGAGASSTVTVSGNAAFTYTVGTVAGLTVVRAGNSFTLTNSGAAPGNHALPVVVTGAGGQVRTLTVNVSVSQPTPQPTPAPTLSVSPASVTLAAGASGTVTVASSTGSYTVQAPQGLTATQSGNTLTLRNDSLAPGQHTVTLATNNAGGSATATVTVTVPQPAPQPVPAPTLSVSPNAVTLASGASSTVTVTSSTGEFTVQAPQGLTATRSGSSLTLRNDSLAPGQHTVTLQTNNAGGTATTAVVVTVPQPAPPAPEEFIVTVNPNTITLGPRESRVVLVSFNQPLSNLDLSKIVPGLQVGSVAGTPTTLSIEITHLDAGNGTYTVPITARSQQGVTRTVNVTVNVAGMPTYKHPSTPIIAVSGQEAALLAAVNEFRTQGTVNGDASIRQGTCAADWKPMPAMEYHGVLHYTARNHALYLEEELSVHNGVFGHEQNNQSNSHYYGQHPWDRTQRAAPEHGYAPVYGVEWAALNGNTAYHAMHAWLNSPPHCAALMDAGYIGGGVGFAQDRRSSTYGFWTLVGSRTYR